MRDTMCIKLNYFISVLLRTAVYSTKMNVWKKHFGMIVIALSFFFRERETNRFWPFWTRRHCAMPVAEAQNVQFRNARCFYAITPIMHWTMFDSLLLLLLLCPSKALFNSYISQFFFIYFSSHALSRFLRASHLMNSYICTLPKCWTLRPIASLRVEFDCFRFLFKATHKKNIQ